MRHPPFPGPEDAGAQDAQWRAFVDDLRAGPDLPFEVHWTAFERIFARRKPEHGPPVVWTPDERALTRSNLAESMRELGFETFSAFHRWSVTDKAGFWTHVLRRLGTVFTKPPETILDLTHGVTRPRWLAGAALNCVDSCFTAPPDRPAIIAGSERGDGLSVLTYGDLERLVNRVASGLRAHGVGPDTAVALYMPMTVECVAAYLGLIRAGCRVVSIADSFSPAEVRVRMDIAGARLVLTVDRYIRAGKPMPLYEKVREAGAPQAIVIPSGAAAPSLRKGDLLWDELLSPNPDFASETGDPYRFTNILFSSGTTGEPKAIPWTHATPLKCGMDGHYHQDIHPDDVAAWPTNIGWMMGPWLIYAALMNRATMALYEGAPHEPGFVRFVRDAGVTVLGVVPSLVRAWRTSGAMEGVDWRGIRVFSSTGEPSNRYDYLWLMSRTGYRAPVIEYLGGTEIGGGHITGTVVQPASPSTFTTPALGVDFVILDEKGRPVKEGENGELFLIPPALGMSQTLLNRDHDSVYYAGCPSGPNGEALRRHGDQTLRLARGFYRSQGRADDTMNLGGIKVSALELERVAEAHDAVYECAAVAVQPEGEGAEHLVVFVVPARDIDRETLLKDLRAMIARQLNPLFKVYDLVLTDHLPRTASNKLMRRALRARYMTKREA
jgi:acetyl-CoA synthetase